MTITTLAHLIERTICFDIINQGYGYYGHSVCYFRRMKWKKASEILKSLSAINILKDPRFEIDDDFACLCLESNFMSNYLLKKIKLGEINRLLENKMYKLKECAPYLYLTGNKNVYKEYSKYHKTNDLPNMNKKRFDKLIKSIDKNGFDNKKIIILGDNNIIIDGQHRACKLLYDYGENFEITVLQIKFKHIDFNKIKPFNLCIK